MSNTPSRYEPIRIKGYSAFYEGRFENPYPPETITSKEWERGFNDAWFENQKNYA
jgi:hypothetical protein